MTTPSQEVERVRRAIDATLACSTARLRVRLEVNMMGRQVRSAGTGVVDLANGRHRITEGEHPVLVDRGHKYRPREDGRWELPMKQLPPAQPALATPQWQLDLLRGTFSAEPTTREYLDGVETQGLCCATDLVEADARTPDGIRIPPADTLRDLRAMTAGVWIGPDDLIRRIQVRTQTSLQAFELFDFDMPPPIELPPEAQVIDPLAGQRS